MRTYSMTLPLEERTLTVLGYMRTIVMTKSSRIKTELAVFLRIPRANCHYAFRVGGGSEFQQTLENKAFQRAGVPRGSVLTSNMGYQRSCESCRVGQRSATHHGSLRLVGCADLPTLQIDRSSLEVGSARRP